MNLSQSRIIGLADIKRRIEQLPKQLQRKAYRSALSSGARIIAKSAKRKIGKGESGLLKKSIGIKYLPATTRSQALGLVGAKRGKGGVYKGERRNPTRYAHLVEKGTVHSAAKPFLRPALIETQGEVFAKMASMIERVVMRSGGIA